MIAWLKGWKESIELCDSPDVNAFAIMLTFAFALGTTLVFVFSAGVALFVVEVVFVTVLKQNGFVSFIDPANIARTIMDAANDVSLGFRIIVQWALNWRIVLMFGAALAFSAAFAQGVLLLLYLVHLRERPIGSIEYRRAVNLIYGFMLISVLAALALQVWCSSQKW
jgi:hypothetical protein